MSFVLILMLAIISLLVAGCGEGEEEGTPKPTATPEATATPTVTEPVHFNDLIPFLPDAPSGWETDDPSGGTFQLQEWSWSQADRDYTNQTTDEYVSVVIHDSAYYQGFAWFSVWEYAFEWETTDGYARSTTVEGYPAWIMYDKPDSYTLMLFVADRFMVMISTETEASLDQFSDLMDLGGIATLD